MQNNKRFCNLVPFRTLVYVGRWRTVNIPSPKRVLCVILYILVILKMFYVSNCNLSPFFGTVSSNFQQIIGLVCFSMFYVTVPKIRDFISQLYEKKIRSKKHLHNSTWHTFIYIGYCTFLFNKFNLTVDSYITLFCIKIPYIFNCLYRVTNTFNYAFVSCCIQDISNTDFHSCSFSSTDIWTS